MLFAEPTRYGAGVILYGDYLDLRYTHQTIHQIASEAEWPLGGGVGEVVLGLAYDIRKAKEGQRESLQLEGNGYEGAVYHGVKILWPAFLAEVALLRLGAKDRDLGKPAEADLLRLEACASSALFSYDEKIGEQAVKWLEEFRNCDARLFREKYLCSAVNVAIYKYIKETKNSKARFKKLPEVLRLIDPRTPEYARFEAHVREQAERAGRRAEHFDAPDEFPAFRW